MNKLLTCGYKTIVEDDDQNPFWKVRKRNFDSKMFKIDPN